MSDEEDDELAKWRKEKGIPDEMWRTFSPQILLLHLIEKVSRRADENDAAARSRAEETQRNMDFIVRQQAQFAADMQQLRETQARSEQRWERTAEGISALLAIAEIHEREINELGETQSRQAEAQARTDIQMAETDRRMADTDERLNALINTAERLIGERRNGGGKGETLDE